MEKLGGTIAAIAIAVSFAGVSSIQPAAAQTVAAAMPVQSPKITLTRAFDGVWSVSIATVNGACPASLRYPALIANGLRRDGQRRIRLSDQRRRLQHRRNHRHREPKWTERHRPWPAVAPARRRHMDDRGPPMQRHLGRRPPQLTGNPAIRHCEERNDDPPTLALRASVGWSPPKRGARRWKQSRAACIGRWIASRSLLSGRATSRGPDGSQ